MSPSIIVFVNDNCLQDAKLLLEKLMWLYIEAF